MAFPSRSLRLIYFVLCVLVVALPADRLSFLPGIPLDFRIAGPLLVAAGLVGFLGKPNRKTCLALAGLCAVKLLLWPFSIQHGLVGTYYSTANFTGPVEQVRLDQSIDFTDDTFPTGFFNDSPRFNFLSPPVDRYQLPFSARWSGYIVGGPLSLNTNQQARIEGSTISFSKGWGPHAYLKLVGARALYPRRYSAVQLVAGRAVRIAQDAVAVAFGLLVLSGLTTVRLGWKGLLFLALSLQGYVRAWSSSGRSFPLAAGQDWLTYESEARDILQHGWLMNGGRPLFTGDPFYQQSFYAYFVALGHWLTGAGFGGIFFSHYLMLAATAVLIYSLTAELFGRNVAIIASLLFVWFEQKYLLQYSDLLLTENLVYPLAAGGVYLYLRQFRTKRWDEVLGAGLLLGLAADTRSTILAFVVLAAAGLVWQRGWQVGLAFSSVAVVVLSFILTRNYLVSGQLALLPTYGWINLRVAHAPPSDLNVAAGPGWNPNLQAVWEFLRQRPTEFARQAWSQTLLILGLTDHWPPAGLPADLGMFFLWPLWLLSFAVLRRQAFRWRPASLSIFALTQLSAVITFGLLAYGLRLALLAYLFLFPFAALTLNTIFRRPKLIAAGIGAAILLGTVIPPSPAVEAAGALADINPDIQLAAAHLPDEVRPGQTFDLDLTWRVLHDPHASYTVSIHGLLDQPNKQVFVADGPPSVLHSDHSRWDDTEPTATWRTGDVLTDVHHVSVPKNAPPGLYRLEIGLYSYRPNLTPESGHASVPLRIEGSQPAVTHTLADFGPIRLVALTTSASSVTLSWQDVGPVAENYTVFVHALNAAGQVVRQDDSQPAAGAWPTSAWRAGQVIVDRHDLVIPSTARQLEVGLYVPQTGQRLRLADGNRDSYRIPLTQATKARTSPLGWKNLKR